MHTFSHLDYLSVTFPASLPETAIEGLVGKLHTIGQGPHGYQKMQRSEIGAVVLSEGPPEMGTNLTLKGEQLEILRQENYPDNELITFMALNRARASRLDLAHDIFSSPVVPTALWELYVSGQAKTRALKDKRFTAKNGTDDGFYLGSEKSDKFLRIYNKGLEQGYDKETWTRLELVCKRLVARANFANPALQANPEGYIKQAIYGYVDFPTFPAYESAMVERNGELPILPRKRKAFWRWVAQQVVPAIVTRQQDYPDEDVLGVILLIINQERARRAETSLVSKKRT